MSAARGFRGRCAAVRFSLDDPTDRAPQGRSRMATMVAQFRANGLRVTPTATPHIQRAIERVGDHLELDKPPEVYVVNNPEANAFAPAYGLYDRPVVVLNGGLVELLAPNELDFAIGHELGHLGLEHGNQPEPGSTFEVVQARARERYKEISADRVGLVATRSVFTAARVMVKLACGLRGEGLSLDIDAFLDQLTDRPAEVDSEWELHTSHPGLPLRLWALLRFSESDVYHSLSGTPGTGTSLAKIDEAVATRLGQLGDGHLEKQEEEVFRLALTWLGAHLVLDDDVISGAERTALAELVGETLAHKVLGFAENHGANAVDQKLREALTRIAAAESAVRSRLLGAFMDFTSALGLSPERTRAWAVLRDALPDEVARLSP